MLHEVVGQLISLHVILLSGGPAPTSDGFKTAIVTTAGVVISAALAAFAVIYQKHRATDVPPTPASLEDEPLVKELRRQIDDAKRNARTHSVLERNYVATIERLEGYLWEAGINPNTGQRINPGEGEPNAAPA